MTDRKPREFIGKAVHELPTPCIVIDRARVEANAARMIRQVESLGIGLRHHVKTHKTVEATRITLGKSCHGVVVSTIAELRGLEPLIADGTVNDVVFGLPVVKSYIPELAKWARKVQLRLMVDHPDHIRILEAAGGAWSVFVKIDGGDHRAGVECSSDILRQLIDALQQSQTVQLFGFYSHASNSYGAKGHEEAAQYLLREFKTTVEAANLVTTPVVISVGATPTAHSVDAFQTFRAALPSHASFEIHAGNYPILDIQQLATGLVHATDIALTLLVEVVSVYEQRNEACVNAGVIALGREPGPLPGFGRVRGREAWFVGKVSQEHGILRTDSNIRAPETFRIGEKLQIEPQHACITAGGHDHFYITNGTDLIEDVWIPWRGW